MRRDVILKVLVSVLGLCVLLLVPTGTAKAQNLYGSIRGTVTDSTGAAVPDVAVTATNMATNISKQVTSKADGGYSFLQLAIGDYSVKAEKTGFQVFAANRIHLDVNTIFIQDISLALGTMSQEVTVQANQTQVETTTPQLGAVVEADQIVNMPLIGRDWINLQALQPGVVSGSDRFGVTGPPDFSTNGAETQFNVFLIDGTDTNDIAINTATFIPSPDAIQEFRMVTSTLNPEYARSSGTIMNIAVKSGTNSFHGDGFDFYRDTFLDSRNYFSTAVNPYHQNIFGATVGGPVIKNHTFFFFSYQGTRAVAPQTNPLGPTQVTPVFDAGQTDGTGTFTGLSTSTNTSPFPLVGDNGTTYPAGTPYSTIFSSGTVPTADINSLSATLLKKYVPAANAVIGGQACTASDSNPTCNQFSFDASQLTKDDQYMFRIDQTFNAHDTIWGTYFQEALPVLDTIPFGGATLPGFGMANSQYSKFVSLDWTHIINDHMLNELRGGYNRFNYHAVYPENPTLPSSAGFSITPQLPSGAQLPVMNVNGLFDLGFSQFGPQPRLDQVYQAGDSFTATEGRHTLKFGFDMRRWEVLNPFSTYNDGFFTFSGAGTYSTGNAGADFLLGIPAFYSQGSGSLDDARTREYYSYAQDQYKLRPNLTLTYGIGWSIDTPFLNGAYDGHAQLAFRPGQQSIVFPGAPVGVVFEGDPGVHAGGAFRPFKYFAPRVGFAYSPNWGWLSGGPGKMSIRGGYGIYYDRSESEQGPGQTTGLPPFAATSTFGPGLAVNPSFANPFVDIATGATVANPFPFAGPSSSVAFTAAAGFLPVFGSCCSVMDAVTQDPMAENYNLTVERQLSNSMLLTVGYVGSVAHHLTLGLPVNFPNASGTFPYDPATYGAIDTTYSGGNSNYNSLQASLKKQLSHGLQFTASYTYAHAIDDSSSFENSTFGEFGGEYGGFGLARATNPYCFRTCDYASSTYDARHRLVISYIYEIPGMHGDWLVSRLTRGWTIAGITTFQTGFPLDVVDLSDPSGGCYPAASDFGCWDGPNQVAPIKYMNPRTTGYWFDPSSFAPVTPNGNPTSVVSYGDAPRNVLRGPGLNNWDFELYKDTQITERTKIELRIESYNVFNHTQFDPNGVGTFDLAGNFGAITQAHNPRFMQLAAKVYF